MTPQPPPSDPSKPASIEYTQGVRDALDEIAAGLKEHGNVDPEDIYQARVKFYGGDPVTPDLPTEPGYYVADRPSYGDTVVVELLHSPAGQWVDAGDREYLTADHVRALGALTKLESRAVTARAVLEYLQPVLPEHWARDCAKAFEVENLYQAKPGPGPKPDLS